MQNSTIESLYDRLKASLAELIEKRNLAGRNLQVRCRVLDSVEAIGSPNDQDYPILRGREHMVEAVFEGCRGQAFADEFENLDGPIERLLEMNVDTTARRAIFIAGLNAVFRWCQLCEKTVHCRDEEPRDCAGHIHDVIPKGEKILLAGLQPRFLEVLAADNPVRAVDLDPRNVGEQRYGVEIEPAEATADAIAWCDRILATGSTIVNGVHRHVSRHGQAGGVLRCHYFGCGRGSGARDVLSCAVPVASESPRHCRASGNRDHESRLTSMNHPLQPKHLVTPGRCHPRELLEFVPRLLGAFQVVANVALDGVALQPDGACVAGGIE